MLESFEVYSRAVALNMLFTGLSSVVVELLGSVVSGPREAIIVLESFEVYSRAVAT